MAEGLNPAQREACLHGDGPLLILAGPGSGKTRVITKRIAHLVSVRGVAPTELIAITFTNKAAKEMRERVEDLLPGTKGLWISTCHASCARILRRDIEALGLEGSGGWTRDFTIYDTSDRNALIKSLVKELGYDAQRFRPPVIGGWISNLKNTAVEEGELTLDEGDGRRPEAYRYVRARHLEDLPPPTEVAGEALQLHGVLGVLLKEVGASQAAKIAAKLCGVSKSVAYEAALSLQDR